MMDVEEAALGPAPAPLAYPHQPQPQPQPESPPVPPKPPLPNISPETAEFLRKFLPQHKFQQEQQKQQDGKGKLAVPNQHYQQQQTQKMNRPFVTLTYATSLDSHLAIAPGQQTALSGPETKSLTHYLRSKHDGILIGVGTATADDPGLNCRLEGIGGVPNPDDDDDDTNDDGILLERTRGGVSAVDAEDLDSPGPDPLAGQPQPIILDPNRRWHFTRDSRIFQAVREGKARAPIILTHAASRQGPGEAERWRILCEHGGMFMCPKEAEKGSPTRGRGGDGLGGGGVGAGGILGGANGGGNAGGIGNDDTVGGTVGSLGVGVGGEPAPSPLGGKKRRRNVRWSWKYLLEFLHTEVGLKSVMIEGGAGVINDLLGSEENLALVDSVILTVAPVYLGKGGVNVSPPGPVVDGERRPAVAFEDVEWTVLGRDVVMVGRPVLPGR